MKMENVPVRQISEIGSLSPGAFGGSAFLLILLWLIFFVLLAPPCQREYGDCIADKEKCGRLW